MDLAFYPDQATLFFAVRILTALVTLCVLILIKNDKDGRYLQSFTMLWLTLPQIMISWMIYKTNGSASIYFIGLHLALYAVGIIVPLSYKEGFTFGVFTCLCYSLACLLNPDPSNDLKQFFGNLLFILFSAVISVICSYYNELSRIKLFSLQNEVEQQNRKLESINRDLTAIKGQLIQKEKMSALGTLSAGLMHELNNPVNYSMMAISMAQMEPEVKLNPLLQESLTDAKEGMARVRDIVTDLKTFAYQKPGDDAERVFPFEGAVRSALRLSGYELKDVTVQKNLPVDTEVIGDEPALIGLLINLFTNAAIALRKSGKNVPFAFIRIHAWHAVRDSDKTNRLYVTVRDNGTGIQSDHLTRIFEPFFTTREVGQGLGLGLAMCYSIIQRHGGELSVKSVEGEWTEFSFDLPTGNAS